MSLSDRVGKTGPVMLVSQMDRHNKSENLETEKDMDSVLGPPGRNTFLPAATPDL